MTFVVVLALGACQIPLGDNATTSDPPVESATLKITIPTIGSGLRSLADAPDETTPSCTLDTSLQPRAMLLATGAEVRLYDAYDLLVRTVSAASVPSFRNMDVEVEDVLAGGGYYLDVDIYNASVSTTEPVTLGTSAPFGVAPGQVTAVTVTVMPNPALMTTITPGSPADISMVGSIPDTATVVPAVFGGEQWFSFVATTNMVRIRATPSATGYVLFDPYNSASAILGPKYSAGLTAATQYPGEPAQGVYEVVSGQTYYLGVLLYNASGTQETGTLLVEALSVAPDASEPDNNNSTGATTISLGTPVTRTFHATADADWYQFPAPLAADTVYTIEIGWPDLPTTIINLQSVLSGVPAPVGTTTEFQFDVDNDLATKAFVPSATGTHYLAVANSASAPLVGEYTFTFDTVSSGSLELSVIDVAGQYPGLTWYAVVVEVGGDPAMDAIAKASATVGSTATATIFPGGGDWTGSGLYDVYVVVDVDSSGDETLTAGDLYDTRTIVVNGATNVDLLAGSLDEY